LIAAVPAVAQQPSADSVRVYELNEVEVLPRPQNVQDFTAALRDGYPAHLRSAGVGGTVQVAFVVDPQGQPGDVRVLATPDSGFNAPTVQAVSMLRFTPAQVGGHAVPVRVEQPITWRAEAAPAVAQAPEVPDSIHVYAVDDADVRPQPRNYRVFQAALPALYPEALRSSGTAAEVTARFAVDPSGAPRYAHVLRSSDARFDAPTLEAVGMLRFQPAQRGGAAVWVWMEVPVEWTAPEGYRDPNASGDSINGYELSAVDVLPRILNAQAFGRALAEAYPPALRDAGEQGMVQVRFRVEPDGTTSHATITRSTEHGFDAPTLEAVRTLRFRPAKVNGRPVRVWVEQPIQWTVSGAGPEWTAPRYERDRGRFRLPPDPCRVSQC
ncbi:MAG TPA: energy transducer TonB, partial [Longimicrobium sp.]|nr:energy transducer TonB [Longimicrobium sp.]